MEEAIKKRSSASVRKLLDLRPEMARVVRKIKGHEEEKEQEIEIPANQVVVGDIIIVKPGEKIPTDGIVVDGASAVDEKMITGESIPVDKKIGDQVIGATLNKQGLLKVRATKVGAETALSQIVHIVEEADIYRKDSKTGRFSICKICSCSSSCGNSFIPYMVFCHG